MTRPSRRVADYAPSTLTFSAELVLAAAVEEAVALLRAHLALGDCSGCSVPNDAQAHLLAAAQSADLILGRAR
jgi:hypothetical protein